MAEKGNPNAVATNYASIGDPHCAADTADSAERVPAPDAEVPTINSLIGNALKKVKAWTELDIGAQVRVGWMG